MVDVVRPEDAPADASIPAAADPPGPDPAGPRTDTAGGGGRVTEIGPPERVDRARHPVAAVLGIVALLAVVVLALLGLGDVLDDRGGSGVQVDEVVLARYAGRPVQDAQRELERLNLIVDVRYEPNEVIPADVVAGQEPIAGARVEVGELVTLIASDGPAGIAVPDLASLSGPEALRLLGTLGFRGELVEVYDETVPTGDVVATAPAAGVRAVLGSRVEVRVSRGPEPRVVPEVVGLPVLEAFAAIGRAELTVGSVLRRVSDRPPETVLSVSPAPGERVPRDQPVEVVVATDLGPLSVPDLVGLTRASAATVAEESGLEVTVRTEAVPAGDRRSGLVMRQSPVVNSPAARGATVTIVVGAAPAPAPATTAPPASPPTTTTTTTPG